MTKYLINGTCFILICLLYLFSWFSWNEVKGSSKLLNIAKQNWIFLPEKSGESSLVSQERAKEGRERRKNFRGEREDELQRTLPVPNREPHCRWGPLLCHFRDAASYTPMPFRLPNTDFCHPWQCVALGTFVGVLSWARRRSMLDAEAYVRL